jgi:hypothetical protein
MKQFVRGLVVTLALAVASQASAETWIIDPAHTVAGFTARHMMITNVTGVFEAAAGTIVEIDQEVPAQDQIKGPQVGQRLNEVQSAEFDHTPQRGRQVVCLSITDTNAAMPVHFLDGDFGQAQFRRELLQEVFRTEAQQVGASHCEQSK